LLLALFAGALGLKGWRGTGKRWRKAIGRIVRQGGPAGVHGAVDVLAWGGVVLWLAGLFGEAHLAAAGVVIRILQLTFMPSEGVAAALLALVGNAVGQERYRLAQSHVRLSLRLNGSYMVGCGICMILLGHEIMEWFSDDEAVIGIGRQALLLMGLVQVFEAMNVTYFHALQGVGDTVWISLFGGALTALVLVGAGLCFVRFLPELQSLGVWIAAAAYSIGLGLGSRWRWKSGRWRSWDLSLPE